MDSKHRHCFRSKAVGPAPPTRAPSPSRRRRPASRVERGHGQADQKSPPPPSRRRQGRLRPPGVDADLLTGPDEVGRRRRARSPPEGFYINGEVDLGSRRRMGKREKLEGSEGRDLRLRRVRRAGARPSVSSTDFRAQGRWRTAWSERAVGMAARRAGGSLQRHRAGGTAGPPPGPTSISTTGRRPAVGQGLLLGAGRRKPRERGGASVKGRHQLRRRRGRPGAARP